MRRMTSGGPFHRAYRGSANPEAFAEWHRANQAETVAFYAANPEHSVKDVAKAGKVKQAFDQSLDAAQG